MSEEARQRGLRRAQEALTERGTRHKFTEEDLRKSRENNAGFQNFSREELFVLGRMGARATIERGHHHTFTKEERSRGGQTHAERVKRARGAREGEGRDEGDDANGRALGAKEPPISPRSPTPGPRAAEPRKKKTAPLRRRAARR